MDAPTPAEEKIEAAPAQARSLPAIWFYRSLGVTAVALGAAGVVLPVLPTTPFLILAAWAFARSSPALSRWLYEHKRFGPILKEWEARGAIPVVGKIAAVVGMSAGWGYIFWRSNGLLIPVLAGAAMLAVAGWILTRPS